MSSFPPLSSSSSQPPGFSAGYNGEYKEFPIETYIEISFFSHHYKDFSNKFTLFEMITLFIHIQKEKEHDYGKCATRLLTTKDLNDKLDVKQFIPTMIYWKSLYLLYYFFGNWQFSEIETNQVRIDPVTWIGDLELSLLESKRDSLMNNFNFFITNLIYIEKGSSYTYQDNPIEYLNKTHAIKLFETAKEILLKIYDQQEKLFEGIEDYDLKFIKHINNLSKKCTQNEKDLAVYAFEICGVDPENKTLLEKVNDKEHYYAIDYEKIFAEKGRSRGIPRLGWVFDNAGAAKAYVTNFDKRNISTNCVLMDPSKSSQKVAHYHMNEQGKVGCIEISSNYNPKGINKGEFTRTIKIERLHVESTFKIDVSHDGRVGEDGKIHLKVDENPSELSKVYADIRDEMGEMNTKVYINEKKVNLDKLNLSDIRKLIIIGLRKSIGDLAYPFQAFFDNILKPNTIVNNDDTIGYMIKFLYIFMHIDLNPTNSKYYHSALSDRTDKYLATSIPYSMKSNFNPTQAELINKLTYKNKKNYTKIKNLEIRLAEMEDEFFTEQQESQREREELLETIQRERNRHKTIENKLMKTEESEKSLAAALLGGMSAGLQQKTHSQEQATKIKTLEKQNQTLQDSYNQIYESYSYLLEQTRGLGLLSTLTPIQELTPLPPPREKRPRTPTQTTPGHTPPRPQKKQKQLDDLDLRALMEAARKSSPKIGGKRNKIKSLKKKRNSRKNKHHTQKHRKKKQKKKHKPFKTRKHHANKQKRKYKKK